MSSTKISAQVVADSINVQGDRIITYLLTFPRFILAELNTHRVFSKNSASSRAIPFEKMVKMVEEDPFIPIAWQKPHKGMQGTEYYDHTLTEEVGGLDYTNLPKRWLRARDTAVSMAKIMADEKGNMPVTKQLANRLLEPFMWHTVLLTGTDFKNFFELRCPSYEIDLPISNDRGEDWKTFKFKSKKDLKKEVYSDEIDNYNDLEWLQINKGQAEIHMMALAEAMYDAYNESTPKQLKAGEWHIPFEDNIDDMSMALITDSIKNVFQVQEGYARKYENTSKELDEVKIKIATARCARLSYMTFDGKIDYEKDIKLHDTLLESQHMSPFEHCARAMSNEEYFCYHKGLVEGEFDHHTEIGSFFRILEEPKFMEDKRNGWCRNFKGFIQYRHLIEEDYDGFRI